MAPPVDPPTSITLRVKVPPGHVPGGADEFTLGSDIAVASKVGQIRERIQEAIPSSPTPERQRLLYGGRALVDNDQTVADALNIRRDPTQTEYVIHLLVKGDGANVTPAPHRTGMRTPARSGSPAALAQAAAGPPTAAPQPAQNPAAPHVLNAQQQWNHHMHQQAIQQQMLQQQAAVLAQANRFNPMFQNQGFAQPMMPFAGHMPGMHIQQGNGVPFQFLQAQAQHYPPHVHNQHVAASQNQHPNSAQAQDQQVDGPTATQPPPSIHTHQNRHDVQVRIQQTLRIPNPAMQAQQRPMGLPTLTSALHPQGLPTPPVNANGPSALDRARENITEMQRILEEIRNTDAVTEAQQAQIQSLEERTRSLNDYIDPFHLGNIGNNRAGSSTPAPGTQPNIRLSQRSALETQPSWQHRAQQIRQTQQQASNTRSQDVTCYLLSSPSGPQALLYSPQHGIYGGQIHQSGSNALQPTPTVAHDASSGTGGNVANQPNQEVAQAQGAAGQQIQAQAQAQAAQPDPLGPLGPIMGHMWLLLRVLIFAYFLLGANMGWRRPLALFAIGMGFWMIRMGLLGDGGALRRWWDGIMNDGRAPPAQQQGQQAQNQQQGEQQGQAPAANGRPGQMPTPEQLAQRLLDENARVRDEARDQRIQWIRERIRPVERAIALLVASLWPGVGEAYVRAREQEERRRAEEEIAARRREEEERQKKEEEEKQKNEGSGTEEKTALPSETEASSASASQQTVDEASLKTEVAGTT